MNLRPILIFLTTVVIGGTCLTQAGKSSNDFKAAAGQEQPITDLSADNALPLVKAGTAVDPITIYVQTQMPGALLSENALGLSYETSLMLPDKNGKRYFRPDNIPLVNIFKTIGIKSLRIGGNSVDAKEIPIPTEADVSSLFEFAKAAKVKVIYSVRLENGDPQSAAVLAKFIYEHYIDQLDCFAIGNEPDYYRDYNVFRPKWKAIYDAILAVCPEAKFCGPDQNPSPTLFSNMVHDFGGGSDRLVQITGHLYPFGCAYKNPGERSDITKLVPFEAKTSREKMLSPQAYAGYERLRKGLADAVAGTTISYRLTEVNSYWFSGLKGASDSYASALWGLDFLHWWTSQGAAGLNFHTGDRTGGALSMPCMYAAFVTSGAGYEARPLAYGMKLYDIGGHGRKLTVSVTSSSVTDLVTYAAIGEDKTVYVTLINKKHDDKATATDVQVQFDARSASPQAIFLTGTNGDIAGGSADARLGGAPIREDGSWDGKWTPLTVSEAGDISITLPPASAAVVKAKLQ